jgi:hypothetical protein
MAHLRAALKREEPEAVVPTSWLSRSVSPSVSSQAHLAPLVDERDSVIEVVERGGRSGRHRPKSHILDPARQGRALLALGGWIGSRHLPSWNGFVPRAAVARPPYTTKSRVADFPLPKPEAGLENRGSGIPLCRL